MRGKPVYSYSPASDYAVFAPLGQRSTGEKVKIAWRVAAGSRVSHSDWIGIYLTGTESQTACLEYFKTHGERTGEVEVALAEPGDFEVPKPFTEKELGLSSFMRRPDTCAETLYSVGVQPGP